jgi:hypothetical protein
MVFHVGVTAGKQFVNNILDKMAGEAKDDVKKASQVVYPITVPTGFAATVLRGTLYNLGFIFGLFVAAIESTLDGDVKKALKKWTETQLDKLAGKVTGGFERVHEAGKGILSSFFGLFSSNKKPPRAKADTSKDSPDAESETDVEEVASPVEQLDDLDRAKAYDDEVRGMGLDPKTMGGDPGSIVQNPVNSGSLSARGGHGKG